MRNDKKDIRKVRLNNLIFGTSTITTAYLYYGLRLGKLISYRLTDVSSLSQYIGIHEFNNLTFKDELELDKIGEEKYAVFLNIPQEDTTYSWITAMLYSTVFRLMYAKGNKRMKDEGLDNPELKIPVRFLIDECANVGKIPNLDKILATCRKYRLSVVPIFQNYSQVVQVYGKETVQTLSYGNSKGKMASTSVNKRSVGKELMSRINVEQMSNAMCLVFIRALKPFKVHKFKLEEHPNYRYTAEANKKYLFKNPFILKYDDEEIEEIRIKRKGEDGYIQPKVVLKNEMIFFTKFSFII